MHPPTLSDTKLDTLTILGISDEVVPTIYHESIRERFGGVDLLVGCGDLPPSYMDFVVSMLNVPCFYVPGNHDGQPEHTEYGRTLSKPDGCRNIDGRVIEHDGLVLGGLGGSVWYNGGPYQYRQVHMTARVALLLPRIMRHKRRNGYGLDIFLTHAPPAGIHDGTGAHAGFKAFRWLIERFPPRYLIHGHIHHRYRISPQKETHLAQTQVINTVGHYLLTLERVAVQQNRRYNAHG